MAYASPASALGGKIGYRFGQLRYVEASEAEDAKFGALVGVYHHTNEHVKLGAGYSSTEFSDDLTDLDYTSHGPFINLLGTF